MVMYRIIYQGWTLKINCYPTLRVLGQCQETLFFIFPLISLLVLTS